MKISIKEILRQLSEGTLSLDDTFDDTDLEMGKFRFEDFYLKVGDLKRIIQERNIPDNAYVLYERIPDYYFNHSGWKTLTKQHKNHGEGNYIQAFAVLDYNDNDQNLYITAHY